VRELVTAMWRQDRLHALELSALTAATAESPPAEATIRKLLTFARYGARIDKDIGRALQTLRVLRDRSDARIDRVQDGTSEPDRAEPHARNFTNELPPPRTSEPTPPAAPGQPAAPRLKLPARNEARGSTTEPTPRLNRQQGRALAAMERQRAA
jgi:hypothetical protein